MPSAYSDDEWNDLNNKQRQQSEALYRQLISGDVADFEAQIATLEPQIEDHGPITSSDDNHDVGKIQAEIDALMDLLRDIKRGNELGDLADESHGSVAQTGI